MRSTEPEKNKPIGKLNMDQTNRRKNFLQWKNTKFYLRQGMDVVKNILLTNFSIHHGWKVTTVSTQRNSTQPKMILRKN